MSIAKEVDKVAKDLQRLVRMKAADKDGFCRCVSCGVLKHWKEMDGGHFISRSKLATKLETTNVHPQCKRCNGFSTSTTVLDYRDYMVEMYGKEWVEWLRKESQKIKKWTRPELLELHLEIKEQLKFQSKRLHGH